MTPDAATNRPKSWAEEACPWHKGYPDERGCTCTPEVIARREARSAAKCLDPTVCNYPNGRCVEPSRCTYPKAAT